jgi:hypothetical protein
VSRVDLDALLREVDRRNAPPLLEALRLDLRDLAQRLTPWTRSASCPHAELVR